MANIPTMNRAERRRQEKAARSGRGASPDAALQQAVGNIQAGKLKRAESLLVRVVKAHPDHPDALHYLGVALYQQSRFEESHARLAEAVAAAPDYAEARNSLGIVLLEKRCLDDAISQISRALEIRPNFAGAHANLGNAYQEQGALDRAVDSYRTALSFDPGHREAAFRLASAHLTRDEPEEALAACESCLAIDPHCQHGLAYKAMALQALGRAEEARELYDYEQMIRPAHLKPPARFADLEQFNDALTDAVRKHPTLVWEPFNRVTRGGAVSGDMLLNPTPTIKLFERALRGAIDEYRESLKEIPGHPLLGRIPRKYRLTLIASILKGGGRHPAHIHESAWLSGVYYVKVPDVVREEDSERAGWLEFGRPDYPPPAGFDPVTTAKPARAGLARFFPSYFFHGTIPFEGAEERIGIAFDAYPDD